jgi:pimeloyl-ACP methyl ester carboxylesterase
MRRVEDREPASGPAIAQAQVAAFRDWEGFSGDRFADLKGIRQPTLVINGTLDDMIPVRNSYWLSENLPNAVLLSRLLISVPRILHASNHGLSRIQIALCSLLT